MKVTFFSNFMNHHQLPVAEEFIKLGIDYTFVATEPIEPERIALGYEDMNKKYPFVLTTYDSEENEKTALKLCIESDVIILGSAPEKYIQERLKYDKLTFRYSERYFKKGLWRILDPRLFFNIHNNNVVYNNKKFYLLTSSAYAAWDFQVYNAFKNKCYKWGYFPKNVKYNVDDLLNEKKNNNKIQILWCGRLIGWKHPEKAIYVAKRLKEDGFDFELKIIGTGKLKQKLEKLIKKNNLNNYVYLTGAVPANKVREYMEKANIYLFTSDYNEGWGAVLNESMNSACAVVASHAIGAVPYLIKNKKNGIIYKDNDKNDLYRSVKLLMNDKKLRNEISYNAYKTISKTWNAETAVKNFLMLVDYLNKNKKNSIKTGPCSKSSSIFQGKMYKTIINDKFNN